MVLAALDIETQARLWREEKRRRQTVRRNAWLFECSLRPEDPESLAAFVRLMWAEVEPARLRWPWHFDTVCRAVQRQMTGDPAYRKLLICLPPGSAKSLLASVLAPAWEWLHSPSRRRLVISSTDRLARRDSRRTRQVLQSKLYRQMVEDLARRRSEEPWDFAADQNEKQNFENTARGFRKCFGMSSKYTGERGDDITIDDPVDVADVISGSQEIIFGRCMAANSAIEQRLSTRVNIQAEARWLLIMQRLHPIDPAGRALAEGDWKAVVLPMEYDPEFPEELGGIYDEDPREAPGELMFPALFPREEVTKLRKKLGWQAPGQLDMRPTAKEGTQFKRAWFSNIYKGAPVSIAVGAQEVAITVDAAKKAGTENDFHSIQVWALYDDNRRYLLDRVHDQMDLPGFLVAMDSVIEKWKAYARFAYIEDAANGTSYMQHRGGSYAGVPLIPFNPQKDTPGKDKSKPVRAGYTETVAQAGLIWLPSPSFAPWVGDWIASHVSFGPSAMHDDDVDAASQLHMRWTREQTDEGGGFASFGW